MLDCLNIALRRCRDLNVLPFVSVVLVFFWALSSTPQGAAFLDRFVQWELIASFVNALADGLDRNTSMNLLHCPMLIKTNDPPLPEDYHLRGQVYSNGLFPKTYFAKADVDVDNRFVEQPAFDERRAYRIKWLAGRIAMVQKKTWDMKGLTLAESSASESESVANSKEGQTTTRLTQRRWLRYEKRSDRFSVRRHQ